MKNVILTLDDDVLARARVQAAREGGSLSKFVGRLVEERVGRNKSQSEAVAAWLRGPLGDFSDETGRIPSRAEVYDDARLRGRERAPLHEGPDSGSGRRRRAG